MGGVGNNLRVSLGSGLSGESVESTVEAGDEPVQCLTHILLHIVELEASSARRKVTLNRPGKNHPLQAARHQHSTATRS